MTSNIMVLRALFLSVFLVSVIGGCAASGSRFTSTEDDDGGSGTSVGGQAASGGAAAVGGASAGDGGAGGDATTWPCGIDCSTIATDPCREAVCNLQSKQCSIEDTLDGTACDDGKFCTVGESCQAGMCAGGSQNDCDIEVPPCTDVICQESTQTCSMAPAMDGASCAPTDLCQINSSCKSGLCVGTVKDCFFSPKPDDCHISECNPQNGLCEPVPGNDGQACDDKSDWCTVDKSCAGGACVGGQAKDCSALTQGCVTGLCDPQNGNCQAMPVLDGELCDDLNPCTNGEICQMGMCAGGAAVTMCMDGDSCCPMGCDENNDVDCGIADLDIGPFGSTYSSSAATRGYWFTAPTSFTIKELRVPTDVGTDPQNIQVVRFNGGVPPNYPGATTNHQTLAYHKAVPGTNYIVVNISVNNGDVIGILGARGTTTMKNSYGNGNPYNTTLFNYPIALQRLVYQANVHNTQAGALSTEAGGSYSRIEMKYGP